MRVRPFAPLVLQKNQRLWAAQEVSMSARVCASALDNHGPECLDSPPLHRIAVHRQKYSRRNSKLLRRIRHRYAMIPRARSHDFPHAPSLRSLRQRPERSPHLERSRRQLRLKLQIDFLAGTLIEKRRSNQPRRRKILPQMFLRLLNRRNTRLNLCPRPRAHLALSFVVTCSAHNSHPSPQKAICPSLN